MFIIYNANTLYIEVSAIYTELVCVQCYPEYKLGVAYLLQFSVPNTMIRLIINLLYPISGLVITSKRPHHEKQVSFKKEVVGARL